MPKGRGRKRPVKAAWKRAYASSPGYNREGRGVRAAVRSGIRRVMSANPGRTRAEARKVVESTGRNIRKGRVSRGLNPNTGKAYTARGLGLKGKARAGYRNADATTKKRMVSRSSSTGKKGIRRAVSRTARTLTPAARKRARALPATNPRANASTGMPAKRQKRTTISAVKTDNSPFKRNNLPPAKKRKRVTTPTGLSKPKKSKSSRPYNY